MKTYGKMHYLPASDGRPALWGIEAAPHVVMRIKRLFGRVSISQEWRAKVLLPQADFVRNNVVMITDTPEVCEDLRWILERYPMEVVDMRRLRKQAKQYVKQVESVDLLLRGITQPCNFDLHLPPRPYQQVGADLWNQVGGLLIADQLGLGKTVTAICALTLAHMRPALVVTKTDLPDQWKREIGRFAPLLNVHIVRSTREERIPDCDVVVVSYSKLAPLLPQLLGRFRSVIFDEVQELRRAESERYAAADKIARSCTHVSGLSATPIYNMGGEFYNIGQIIRPGFFGTREEFVREHCAQDEENASKLKIRNTVEFGSYLRDNFFMLRRTRKEVGRELPPSTDVVHEIEIDYDRFNNSTNTAVELARRALSGSFTERGLATREFDLRMRQATGIAKAPGTADFYRMLVEESGPTVCFAWHREVYSILQERLKDLNPVFYTGEETPKQKLAAFEAFTKGDSPLFIMSLRAGAGLDGLQYVSSTGAFGELDWARGVMSQCKGRLDRDGQTDPVTCYYLVSQEGSDPIVSETLGIKGAQLDGIVDLGKPTDDVILETDGSSIQKVARAFLERRGIKPPKVEEIAA